MKLKLFSLIVIIISVLKLKAQSNNLDFEMNSFKYWNCYYDNSNLLPTSDSIGNTTAASLFTITYKKAAVSPYQLITLGSGLDMYGKFPVKCNLSGGGNYSARLGYGQNQSVAQGLIYNLRIPTNANKYNVVFYYAAVLEDPGAHTCTEMPIFNVNVFDSANPSVQFTNLSLTINKCNPAFIPNLLKSNTLSPNGDTVFYTAWQPANMIINNMAGKTVTIRVMSAGCSPGGFPGIHFGYGYIDFNSSTNIQYNQDTLNICENDDCYSFTPPSGYKGYIVYDSATNNVLAIDTIHVKNAITTFNLCGNNKPSINSVMKVALIPHSWYGFADTLTYYIKSNNCPGNSPSLTINKIDSSTCSVSVDVPIIGKGLHDISTLKGTIYFDTTYMKLGGIKFTGSNNLLSYSNVDISNGVNGYVTYNWTDSVNHTLADSSQLFTLVLIPKPNFSGGSAVWFDSIPNKLEIDTAKGIAAINALYNNGWIMMADTPQIVQNVNIISCYAGCLPIHYQWYVNGLPIQFDTLSYIYPTSNGVYTCVVTYKSGNSVSSNTVNVVLPVTLVSFNVSGFKSLNGNTNALIKWQTASEINTAYFNVQRSTSGKDFSTIGKLNAKGASDYSFNDIPTSEVNVLYYRLEIVDRDGSKTYSEVRQLIINNVQLIISPNPAKDMVTIYGSNLKQVTLVDFTGRTIIAKAVNGNSIKLAVGNLSKGIYLVKGILSDGSIYTEKLNIK